MTKCIWTLMALLAIFGALITTHSAASADEHLFTFSPEDGVKVKVVRVDATHVKLHILPSGKEQSFLVTEGNVAPANNINSSFESKDFNFDGHTDLAMINPVGMVNETYDIFLYRPESQNFERLILPAQSAADCDGLQGVMTRSNKKILLSSCRSGPTWYTDAYRFNDRGRLYLYGTERLLDDDIADRLCSIPLGTQSPDLLELRYDQRGKVIAEACQSYQDWHDITIPSRLQFIVGASRLPLHDAPDDKLTHRYLIKGDRPEVIDVSDIWLQVRYQNPRRGPIIGWIRADEAGLALSRH